MLTLYVNYSASIRVEGRLAPRSPRAPPSNLAVSRTAVESKSVPADRDAHLALLAEAVGREAVHTGTDETDWKECVG